MCGIVGAISTSPGMSAKEREKFFRTALIVDQIRGFHSTGFFKVNNSYTKDSYGSMFTVKKAFNANDFLELKQVDSMLSNLHTTEILIGHNRWATMGDVTHATAHPFTHGPITLVHNGTLHWWNDLPGSNQFDVDSEAIAYALSTVEPDEARKILEKLDGAYALVWYDARIGKLRAARNEERPLHFCYSKDSKDMLLASEAGMLEWLAERHGFKPQEIWQLKEGALLTLDRKDLTEYTVEEFEVYDDGYGDYSKWGNNYYQASKKEDQKKLEDNSGKKDSGVDTPLLKLYGLQERGEVCFDPTEFAFYPSNGTDGIREWGKLIGRVNTPTGMSIYCEVDGLRASECAEMVGYSIVATVINITETRDDDEAKTILKLKEPNWVFDDSESDLEQVEGYNVGGDDGPVTRYGPFNQLITEERWLELIDFGCNMCGADIDEEEDEVTGWDSEGKPICKTCISQNGWEDVLPVV